MQEQMLDYFAAEKAEAALFIAIAAFALALGAWLLWNGHAYRGAAWPLIAIAVIQLIVGGTVFTRTEGQVATLQAQLEEAPVEFRAEELDRMATVMQNFRIYKVIEIVLLAAGIALSYLFFRHELIYGIAAGLIAQSAIMLLLDLFAERRADVYITHLQQLPG